MLDVLDMGASGLQAQRTRMDTIAANILNINTTHNARGEKVPYQRRFVVFSPERGSDPTKPGVRADVRIDARSPFHDDRPTQRSGQRPTGSSHRKRCFRRSVKR